MRYVHFVLLKGQIIDNKLLLPGATGAFNLMLSRIEHGSGVLHFRRMRFGYLVSIRSASGSAAISHW